MSVSDADIAYALELFTPLGGVTTRKMFGGLMMYHDGQTFALLSGDNQIYLKASGVFAEEMAQHGARIFSMVNKHGQTQSMGYWTLPEAALDDPDLACDWARRALDHLG